MTLSLVAIMTRPRATVAKPQRTEKKERKESEGRKEREEVSAVLEERRGEKRGERKRGKPRD